MSDQIIREQPLGRRAAIARCGRRVAALELSDVQVWTRDPLNATDNQTAPTREQLAVLNAVRHAGGRSETLPDLDAARECVERAWLNVDRDGAFALTVLGAFVVGSRRH
jgi:hypothetical protein